MAGSDYRAGRLCIVVTFDEDDRTAANAVLTMVIAPTMSRIVASVPLTHYSLSRHLAERAAGPADRRGSHRHITDRPTGCPPALVGQSVSPDHARQVGTAHWLEPPDGSVGRSVGAPNLARHPMSTQPAPRTAVPGSVTRPESGADAHRPGADRVSPTSRASPTWRFTAGSLSGRLLTTTIPRVVGGGGAVFISSSVVVGACPRAA
jgi:hypothetical protein